MPIPVVREHIGSRPRQVGGVGGIVAHRPARRGNRAGDRRQLVDRPGGVGWRARSRRLRPAATRNVARGEGVRARLFAPTGIACDGNGAHHPALTALGCATEIPDHRGGGQLVSVSCGPPGESPLQFAVAEEGRNRARLVQRPITRRAPFTCRPALRGGDAGDGDDRSGSLHQAGQFCNSPFVTVPVEEQPDAVGARSCPLPSSRPAVVAGRAGDRVKDIFRAVPVDRTGRRCPGPARAVPVDREGGGRAFSRRRCWSR